MNKQWLSAPAGARVGLVFVWVLTVSAWLAPGVASDAPRVQSAALQILVVAGTPLLVAKLAGLRLDDLFRLRPISLFQAVLAILLGLCLIPWLEEVHYFQGQLSEEVGQLQQRTRSWLQGYLLWVLLTMALLPAVCEELLFRGFVLNQLLRPGNHAQAILVSAVLFGVFHRHLLLVLPASLAGILFAIMVNRSESLWPAVIAHFSVNSCAIVVSNWEVATSIPWLGGPVPVPLAVLVTSGIGLFVLGGQLRKQRN